MTRCGSASQVSMELLLGKGCLCTVALIEMLPNIFKTYRLRSFFLCSFAWQFEELPSPERGGCWSYSTSNTSLPPVPCLKTLLPPLALLTGLGKSYKYYSENCVPRLSRWSQDFPRGGTAEKPSWSQDGVMVKCVLWAPWRKGGLKMYLPKTDVSLRSKTLATLLAKESCPHHRLLFKGSVALQAQEAPLNSSLLPAQFAGTVLLLCLLPGRCPQSSNAGRRILEEPAAFS